MRNEAHSASGSVCHGKGAWAPHSTAVAYLGERVGGQGREGQGSGVRVEGWGVGFGAGMRAGAAAAHRIVASLAPLPPSYYTSHYTSHCTSRVEYLLY